MWGDKALPAGQACWRWERVISDLTPSPAKRSQMFFSPILSLSHIFLVFFCFFEPVSVLRASALFLSCLLYVLSLPNALCPLMPCCIKLEQRTLFFFHNRVQFSRWACSRCLVCLAFLFPDLPPWPFSSRRLKLLHADARTIPFPSVPPLQGLVGAVALTHSH